MKKIKILTLAAVLALAGFGLMHYFYPGSEVLFDIKEGSNGTQIARELKEQRIIASTGWFRALLHFTNARKRLRPGRYKLRTHMSSEAVIWTLFHTDGKYYIRLGVPEGFRAEQIAEKLQSLGITKGDDFMKIVRDEKLEGQLFPSTYFMGEHVPARQVADMMLHEFNAQVRPLLGGALPDGLNAQQVLTIASIVEREAVVQEDRPLIAAVYINRLKKNMLLEADPTVQYALGYISQEKSWWKRRMLLGDLKVESPYNTYRYIGMPPGPICNPGLDSVKAVLNPAPIAALYFVADRQGHHIFNEDYKEHLKAKHLVEMQSAR
jgi:UPF0755 protein